MTTWIEIVDSAIKIGLGALIAGGVAVYRDQALSKNEKSKLLFNEEQQILKETIKQLSEFQDEFRKCAVNVDKNDQTKFAGIWPHISKITLAVTNLLYLGLDNCHKDLISYMSAVESYVGKVQKHIQDTGGDNYQNKLEPIYGSLVNQYENLIRKIANDFRSR